MKLILYAYIMNRYQKLIWSNLWYGSNFDFGYNYAIYQAIFSYLRKI